MDWGGHGYITAVGSARGAAAAAIGAERIAHSEALLEAWRDEHPDAMASWEAGNGCVVAFGGMKVYYGRCVDCNAVVTTRRADPARVAVRGRGKGRWPLRCATCREQKRQEHDDKARVRMARVRAERRQGRRERRLNPKREMWGDTELTDGFVHDHPAFPRFDLVGKSLGIWCLDCGQVIRFALHITFPRPIPKRADTPK